MCVAKNVHMYEYLWRGEADTGIFLMLSTLYH